MVQDWWWKWLVEAMTGGGGQRRRKMNTGRGAEGGCGTEEKLCPISIPSVTTGGAEVTVRGLHSSEIAEKPSNPEEIAPVPPPLQNSISSVDFFTQARKALCLRSPFDSDESSGAGTSASASSIGPSSTILPSGLAQFLSKHSDSRKRNKRSLSGAEHKGRPEKSRGSNIWVETEEYFRELTGEDIDKLYQVSSFGFSSSDECFRIPALDNVGSVHNMCNVGNVSILVNEDVVNSGSSNGVVELEAGRAVVQEEGEEEEDVEEGGREANDQQFMDVDSVGGGANEIVKEGKGGEEGIKEEKGCLEWLLGSKSKIYLTSERPSKKRKLLGGDAGLEKLLVAHPAEGSTTLCHFCSIRDIADPLNQLIVCSSCGVAVHQRCYGVQNDVHGPWLCSWCQRKNDGQSVDRPCLLCPKQGGALKPVLMRENDEPEVDYAHLFCSLWMPEVFVENIRTMEPIMNADGIKDTRRKLICYLCKMKCGACVRCSNGACRTSFHPICAREASHRMEIWGRHGGDEVELRAFCSKHSEIENGTSHWTGGTPVSSDSMLPVTPSLDKLHIVKIGRKNGDKMAINVETALDCDELNESRLNEDGFLEKDTAEDTNASDSLNFIAMLKKLIDQGKISLEDVATELGISLDSLSTVLNDNHVAPDLHKKIDTWLTHHGYAGSLPKSLKVKIKSTVSPKAEAHPDVEFDLSAVTAAETDISNVVPVKSVPPRRRTKSDIRIVKNDEVLCTSNETITENAAMDKVKSNTAFREGGSSKECSDGIEKNKSEAYQDVLATNSPKTQGEPLRVILPGLSENGHSNEVDVPGQNLMVNCANLSVVQPQMSDLIKSGTSSSYIHPLIQHELTGIDSAADCDGSRDRKMSQLGASSSSGVCCSHHHQQTTSADSISKFCGSNLEQLVKARNMGLLELSPADEVEGELIFYQHRLLANAAARKLFINDLISRVATSFQQEIDSTRKQKWDAVLLSQYLYELREAKKKGRKERRHKEAQAVLAAATAAAAASSRMSAFRKDSLEESANVEELSVVNASNGRAGFYSQQNPRVKETVSRSAAARILSERDSDSSYMGSDFSVEHPRTCDICRRSETILNRILVCSSCKVAVHLDCYHSVKNSTGPWYCELCEDLLSSRGSGVLTTNSWEKPYSVAECGLCGGTAGAFRKSTDGQWIHAFCAEWVLESTFRRGQVNPIEGMEMVSKGGDVCVICCRKQGVCIKCNYGNCQMTFHPSCARSTGFYMNVSGGGKLQHKAYCGKHSLEQQAKAETQKHGMEEFKSLKQVRVELERLRLLCERIVKREKLKRELVLCSYGILSSNRDAVVLSALTRHPLNHPDISSESATTSTRGYTDGNKSGSDTIQRSDDISVDSTIAGKRRIKFPTPMDNDQKTDDSSVSQHLVTQKPTERMPFSGKQIPNRPALARNLSDDADKRSRYRKHTETFEKELVMTSDQASMKNQRLPKGFVYVPIRCLSKERETDPDACSREPLQRDG